MINCIHSSHVGQQSLCSADIRSGFFAPDVLFTCLQRHTQAAVSHSINTDSDDAAGNTSFKFLLGGKESSMRTTESHSDTKSLRRTDGYISAEFTRSR